MTVILSNLLGIPKDKNCVKQSDNRLSQAKRQLSAEPVDLSIQFQLLTNECEQNISRLMSAVSRLNNLQVKIRTLPQNNR